MNPKFPDFFKDPHILAQKEQNSPVLLGLSGGADSSALLFLLSKLQKEKHFPLYAAHVNHNIRTADYNNEAMRDENFCREICRQLDVELFVADIDVPRLSKESGQSLETVAREARYRFFSEIMEKKGIGILVTAHNADDNLETQIFNLCRGCGISGICGIPETRALKDPLGSIAVRPILGATKAEILRFCEDNGISYITDSTNFENDCTRNRIRNIIVPELNSLFGSPQISALRLAAAAKEDNDHILFEARAFLRGKSSIPSDGLTFLSPAVAKRVLMLAFEESSSSTLEWVHIDAILDFAKSGKDGMISLPSSFCAVFDGGMISFKPQSETFTTNSEYSISLKEGFNGIPNTPFAVTVSRAIPESDALIHKGDSFSLYSHALVKEIDLAELTADSRRMGEVIFDGGMHKRIKKLMCDKKIPKNLRNLPVIHKNGEAIYVPKCALSDRIRAKKTDFELVISVYIKDE